MKNLCKGIQLMLVFLESPFLVLHFSYQKLMTFLMMLSVILLSILMILLSTLSVIWQQLKLDSELESNLRETVDWGRKWLDFNAGKTQLVLFGQSSFPSASVQFPATKSSVI